MPGKSDRWPRRGLRAATQSGGDTDDEFSEIPAFQQADKGVGRVLDALTAAGLAGNTIVIFTSDNGTTHDVGGVDHEFFNSVDSLKGLKGQLYEGGISVPDTIRWPGKISPDRIIT